jgi:hypothetical protein
MFGGSIFSSLVNSNNLSQGVPDYKFERMGIQSTSILLNAGDLIVLWGILFISYCVIYAIEFVLNAYPYVKNVCHRYRNNFFNAGMNFTFVKMAFDVTFSLMFMEVNNTD